MRDRIVAAYLKNFTSQFGLADLSEAEAFEHFVNYCIISKHHPDPFEPDDVSVGGTGDLGLDGIGILVNDHLVYARSDVDYFKKALRRLDVQFVFIQSKSSAHFDAADIGTFLSGVRQFFVGQHAADANGKVLELLDIKEHIFDASIDMDRTPSCRLYFVTTGTWNNDPPLRARIDQGISDLKQTGLFSTVDFVPVDSEGLKRTYRELNHKVVREIVFEKHTILPQIGGIEEAYIGIVPCLEYLKLLHDDDGALNRRLFYDNVRDFQGHNPVNTEIQETLESTQSDRFALLNNGVTIVARDVNKVGARFRLKDYQIVNGCQTSHILYLNRDRLTDNIYLPLKLIVTIGSEITNQIIQGTNRQTEVKLEAFESLAPFQKKLEEFYVALGQARKEPLYYERRSKQYDHLGTARDRIVTLAAQIKCFVAMFLNEPHSTHRYYGELLSSYRGRLFGDSHSLFPYFVSAVALTAIDRLLAANRLPRHLRHLKFQLLMVFRIQSGSNNLPALNAKAIDKYCDALLEILDDPVSCEEAFRKAARLVNSIQTRSGPSREPPERTRAFTLALIEAAANGKMESPAATTLVSGTVKWFSEVRGYGFIAGDDGRDVFVHFSNIVGIGYRKLIQGQRVEFAAIEAERGPEATEVRAI
jgi:cold shock CspA family protein